MGYRNKKTNTSKNNMTDKFLIDSHKMQYHTGRTSQWLHSEDKAQVFPIYVEVSPVGACNHRCTFCAVDYIGYKNIRLDKEALKNCIMSMSECGVKSIMFAGEGEPTLYKDLPEVINHAKALEIDIALTTNGTGLTEKFITSCLHNISWIKVSFNAGTKETYSQIHQTEKKDFDLVWNNIQRAVKFKNEQKLNTTIGIQSVLLPENAREMIDLALLAKSSNVDYLVIKPYSQHLSSITTKYKDINYNDYLWLRDSLDGIKSGTFEIVFRDESMSSHDSGSRKYKKCYSTPYLWAYLMASGDLYGCSAYLLDDKFNYGNINQNSFKEIWLGEKRRESIRFVEHELDISNCRLNCRMDKVNQYLWDIKHPGPHANFI